MPTDHGLLPGTDGELPRDIAAEPADIEERVRVHLGGNGIRPESLAWDCANETLDTGSVDCLLYLLEAAWLLRLYARGEGR